MRRQRRRGALAATATATAGAQRSDISKIPGEGNVEIHREELFSPVTPLSTRQQLISAAYRCWPPVGSANLLIFSVYTPVIDTASRRGASIG